MKKVTLIGDSIRMSYQQTVAAALADVAEVWAPEENCRSSADLLANLDAWALERPADVIQVNCGLHDLKRDFDTGEPAIAAGVYALNVRQVLRRILAATDATVIWATITPVNEVWHRLNKPFDRRAADVDDYNAAAANVAAELAVPVNDLFAVVDAAGRDNWLKPDGVHFTDELGKIELGKAVAAFLRPYLT